MTGRKIATMLTVLCCLVAAGVSAQLQTKPKGRAARIERHRIDGRENNLFFTFASGLTAFNQAVLTLKAEYSRQITGGLYWGTAFSARLHGFSPTTYDWTGYGGDPYRNTLDQDIYKLDAMLFYRIPIIASRLYFRVGGGAGVGYHRIREISEQSGYDDRVLPYLNIEAAWILRVTRHFEMKFSPTVFLAPSEFAVSPVMLGRPTDVRPWLTDAGFSLTFGWRF